MMSNPKGLKNIPAIRQNVAMFLRNICFQVITIHLFGFKVYEFEKIKFFFINIFVQVIILCIFVEIIKKSITMKNLFFALLILVVSSCGMNKVVSKTENVRLVRCLVPNLGDTAVVLPFENYLYDGVMLSNFEDTLRVPDYSSVFCPEL
jgi:hypothetical protein